MNESLGRMNCLLQPLDGLEAFARLREDVGAGKLCALYGADDSQRVHLLAGLMGAAKRPMLILAPNDSLAIHMVEDLNVLTAGAALESTGFEHSGLQSRLARPEGSDNLGAARFLPARDVSFVKSSAASRDLAMRRIEVIGACLTGACRVLVVPVDAALHRMAPVDRFRDRMLTLRAGEQVEPNDLMAKLTAAGYERVQLVEARGQCALRGGILDVYPVGEANALRVEFFDDEIDSIRSFDVMTQRSISNRESAHIYPAKEFLLTQEERLYAAQRIQY